MKKAPSANTQAGVVQAAEEWATTVDDATVWSGGTGMAQCNNQPVEARGYITNNMLIRSTNNPTSKRTLSSEKNPHCVQTAPVNCKSVT